MPLSSPTSVGNFNSNNAGEVPHGTGSFSNSITTVNNSLLVVAVLVSAGSSDDISGNMSISGDGLTYTREVFEPYSDGSDFQHVIAIYTAEVTSGSTFNLVLDCGAVDVYAYKISAWYYTGHDTADPVGATAQDNTTNFADFNITLSATPSASSSIFAIEGISVQESANLLAGTDFTELYDNYHTDGFSHLFVQHRPPGSISTTVNFDQTLQGTFIMKGAIAIEILEASASPPPDPSHITQIIVYHHDLEEVS